jgi:hypothetical protein
MREALTGSRGPEGEDERGPVRRMLAALRGGDAEESRLREILAEALAEDPASRPTAADLADALAEISGPRPQEPVAELLAEVADVG